MKYKKILSITIVMLALCILLSACGAAETTTPTPTPSPTPSPTPEPTGYFDISFTDYMNSFNNKWSSSGIEIKEISGGFCVSINGSNTKFHVFNDDINTIKSNSASGYSTVKLEKFNRLRVRQYTSGAAEISTDDIALVVMIGACFANTFDDSVTLDSLLNDITVTLHSDYLCYAYWEYGDIRYELNMSSSQYSNETEYIFDCLFNG